MRTYGIVSTGEPFQTLTEEIEHKRQDIQDSILLWAKGHVPRYPWRQYGKTPYEVLVGEAWLKQTPSSSVMRVYQRFMQKFCSFKTLACAHDNELEDACYSLGLGRSAHYIKLMVKRLLKEGKGCLPKDTETFIKTSGLEQYQIKAIFCFGYGMSIAVVDRNGTRMLSRIFKNSLPCPPEEGLIQAIGEYLLPFCNAQCYNCGFLDIAEFVCRNEHPLCSRCPIGKLCDYAEALPQNRNPSPALREYVSV